MLTSWTRNARAAIVVLGLSAALAAGTAQGALAQPKIDDTGGAGGATSTAAAAPTTAPQAPAAPAPMTPAPNPTACDTTAAPAPVPPNPGPGVHKGVIIAPGGGAPEPKPPACEGAGATAAPTGTPASPPDHGAGATVTPPAPASPVPPAGAGTGGTVAPPAPGTAPEGQAAGDAAPPSGPVIHKGVVFPPSTEAPKPTAAAPTAALSSIANATVIRSRSVSTIVTVPAGLPVTDPTEISILFGFSGSSRMTQIYNPAAGNRFVFNFDAGDGTARTEDVAVSLADRAVAGAHFGFVAKVPVEALYDATLSPLTFTLVNDCDFDFAMLFPQNSEPVIHWGDDRGQDATGELSMRAFNSITINKFARTLTAISVKDNIKAPTLWWDEIDDVPNIPIGFTSHAQDAGPLLPSTTTHTESYTSHADSDGACNGNFHFTETVNLLTYDAL